MFKKLSFWYHQICVHRWLTEAHDPLFMFREDLETKGKAQILDVVMFMENLMDDLRKTEGKDEATIIRERWQALQFGKVLEQYNMALVKLDELLDAIPKPTKIIKEDVIIYNGFNDPNE